MKKRILQNTDVAVSNGLIVAIGQNLENKMGQKKSMEPTNILTAGIIDSTHILPHHQ